MRVFDFIDLDGGKKEPLVSGHVNQSGGTFQFYLNRSSYSSGGTTVTVSVDSKGYWKWNNEQGYNITSLAGMFYQKTLLTDITFRSDFDTSNVTDMNSMFQNCSSLTTLDLSGWNTSKVTTMTNTFNGCSALTSINVSGWNTSNVTTMNSMFAYCDALTTIDLSKFDNSKVTNISTMFYYCPVLNYVNLSGWNTVKLTTMNRVFTGCPKLTYLKLNNWTTKQTTAYSDFVPNVSTLTIDYKPSKWNSAIPTGFASVNWHSVE